VIGKATESEEGEGVSVARRRILYHHAQPVQIREMANQKPEPTSKRKMELIMPSTLHCHCGIYRNLFRIQNVLVLSF